MLTARDMLGGVRRHECIAVEFEESAAHGLG